MKRILNYIDTVPFQELDIKELENRKEAMEKEAERCRELRDCLYVDFREGIISKDDYAELYDGYTEKRRKAEEAIRSIERQITEILESKSDKYQWLDYFTEHQNLKELTRTVAVELIDRIKVYDKKTIEVVFNFDDCYHTLLGQMKTLGCEIASEKKEVM
jgi:arginyl-tRNA--protein-N-Asp/Glu arginylyltransferase